MCSARTVLFLLSVMTAYSASNYLLGVGILLFIAFLNFFFRYLEFENQDIGLDNLPIEAKRYYDFHFGLGAYERDSKFHGFPIFINTFVFMFFIYNLAKLVKWLF